MKAGTNQVFLRDDRIVETVEILQARISDRFPDSGLSRLCGELLNLAKQASARSAWISRPIIWIRGLGYLLAASMIGLLYAIISHAVITEDLKRLTFVEFIQTFDAALNGAILISLAMYFLISLESRIKRRRALAAVHELRSIAHVIDMHQLTKDPERVLSDWSHTKHSPQTKMTPFQLTRYLDYCSEMLALTGKLASLYIQRFDDADAVAAVSELEQLSTGLSRKIWQKITSSRLAVDLSETQAMAVKQPLPPPSNQAPQPIPSAADKPPQAS